MSTKNIFRDRLNNEISEADVGKTIRAAGSSDLLLVGLRTFVTTEVFLS